MDPDAIGELADAEVHRELAGGHQSRVFEATLRVSGERVVLKVLDASLNDAGQVASRVAVIERLAVSDTRVCRPVRLNGSFVTPVVSSVGERRLVVCYEYADGRTVDVTDVADATLMGQTLAELHVSMRALSVELPMVAALRSLPSAPVRGHLQLVHGDFSDANLRRADDTLRVFDLEDCGLGTPAFEVANSLYMVLFDALTTGRIERFQRFEEPFVAGYNSRAAQPVEADEIVVLTDLRVGALKAWLDDLSSAPVGIRTASPEWHDVLRRFVNDYRR